MKILLFLMLGLSVLLAGCRCAVDEEPRSLPGGFTDASLEDEEVLEAAGFAAERIAEAGPYSDVFIREILRAEQQVVAGMNYRLLLSVEAGGEARTAEALVRRKLSGEHELLSLKFR